MSFSRYERYQPSGVEGLGEVPDHWRITPLKSIGYFKAGAGFPDDEQGLEGAELSFHKVNALGNSDATGFLLPSENTISRDTAKRLRAFIFPPNSIVFAKIGAALLLGRVRLLNEFACLDNNMMGFVVNSTHNVSFVRHVLSIIRFDLIANPGTVPSLNERQTASLRFAFPEAAEQRAISSFLDRETAKIDGLVEEQKRLIELLKEKRQAIIAHAIAKGLDPNAPTKPSGVAWLGEVPEHWQVRPLKYLVRFESGGTPSKDKADYWEGHVPWASAKDLKTELLQDTIDHTTDTAIEEGAASLVPVGSVLVLVRGMMLARTFPVVQTAVPVAINQDLKALNGFSEMRNDYLAWLLRGSSAETLSRLDEAAHGTMALRMDAWAEMPLPVPSIGEQADIASYLSRKTQIIDALIDEAGSAVDLLQERRAALISAAVTGKVDVRGTITERDESHLAAVMQSIEEKLGGERMSDSHAQKPESMNIDRLLKSASCFTTKPEAVEPFVRGSRPRRIKTK